MSSYPYPTASHPHPNYPHHPPDTGTTSASTDEDSPFSFSYGDNNNNDTSSPYAYTYHHDDNAGASTSNAAGRPTTSSGMGGFRPGTSTGLGSNPFRQQVYQEQYGFQAPVDGASTSAGDPVFAAPPPSRRGRGVSSRGMSRGMGVGGVGGVGGIEEEEGEYYVEESEEESDDEGLFAFLPPSTADQERERERDEVEERERLREGGRAERERERAEREGQFAYGAGAGEGAAVSDHLRMLQGGSEGGDASSSAPPGYPVRGGPAQYEPPVSPPSTESNSGSRAGVGGAGEFRMTRLDAAGRRSGEEAVAEGDESRRSKESRRVSGGSVRRRSVESRKDEGAKEDVQAGKENAAEQEEEEEAKGDADVVYPRHFQHFQPNPARYNANSGPYKRHREYHHQQAYPQYASGVSVGGASSRGNTAGTVGGLPSTAGSGAHYPYGYGYGGDYEDRERYREQVAREKRRKQRRAGTGTTVGTTVGTQSEMGGYGAGSEYSGSNQHPHQRREAGKGTEISEVVEDEGGSMSKRSVYFEGDSRHEDDMYDDGEGYEDGDSREGSIKMEFDFDAIEDEDSPYPEVRASVSNIDDPDMPAMTIRMWFVGLLLCMTSSAFNVFFNFRSPAPSIVPLVLLLLSYPVGKFLAFTLPITTYRIPLPCVPSRWLPASLPRSVMRMLRPMTFPHAIEFSLNPGPWNIKEHVLVFIMANVAVGNPYALNAIVVLEVYYEFKTGYWFSLVLVLATQLTGFGLAGMCRRFLVWPASMVWPQNLVACTLLNTLHAEDEDDGIGMLGGPSMVGGEVEGGVPVLRKKGMSRYRFFMITMVASFFFWFLPGYLFEALSFFSFVCWAVPDNVKVNQVFGVRTGLGMSVLTFDWTQITWIGSPLMVPWWAEVHIFAGFVLFYWIMTPILYYTNSWKLAYFPISANGPYDRFGNSYNIGGVLKADGTFDEEAYNRYSPLFLPATYAVTYLLAFCLSTCVIVHTVLYHGHTLLNGFKKMRVENDDIHAKLMRNYPEVPDWWYATAFCAFFALAVVAVEIWDTNVPVWALLLSVLLPVIYILPSGFIYAMTGQGINLNILAQIIPGSLLPGQPLANMVFKSYSVQTLAEATSFVQDLKLGHYVKVPPRATFLVQLAATVLAAFIQVGVKQWIFDNVEDICQPSQKSQLTCPHNQVFYTASAVWGLIGPTRQFGTGSIYHWHLYAIVVGVFLPIPFWLWRRRYPNSWVKWVSTPVVLNGVSWIPPATGINYSSWFAVGVIFQYVVRKRNFAWWSKFNYVLSSALDSGTVIAVIVIFFTLQFPRYNKNSDEAGVTLKWWGNMVHRNTADWKAIPYLPIPEGGIPLPD